MFITSEGNYSRIMLSCGKAYLIRGNLSFMERCIESQFPTEVAKQFLRLGRSLIVRRDNILYLNTSRGELLLRTGSTNPPYRMKDIKPALLKKLKQILEGE